MNPLQLKKDVRFRRVVDEAVVLRQQEAEVLVLNDLGGRVLELIGPPGEGRSVEEMVAVLVEEYDVEPARLQEDVSAFLAELIERGVIEGDLEEGTD